MSTQVVGNHAGVDARWQRALERAIADGLDVLVEPISGQTFVESSSQPGTLYAVGPNSCTCPAGERGIPCKHRAALLAQTGELAMPEVKEISLTPASVDCPICRGAGQVYVEVDGGRAWPDQVPCYRCHGTGQLPVVICSISATAEKSVAVAVD